MKPTADDFLSQYDEPVFEQALLLKKVILENLPGITGQVDLSAKMVHFVYGPKYADLVCAIIPSKKGLKLGFNRGTELPDPDGLLEGTGKISRYVVITSVQQIKSAPIKKLLKAALVAYHERSNKR